ncbi:aldolase/citrate lyase family protein [Brevibacterium daeguense]|uniref:Aldolase/citrate lyase family protein n=1 Tax=Brevibacterium daeguense TaxID=909936 RepID=A0ABP8EFL9_9MICO|nr:aldolase/citrate lyase family protein [Brevibacterium daeguense]
MTDLRQRLLSAEPTTGYFCLSSTPLTLERLAEIGYDYIVIDGQHGTYSENEWLGCMQAIEAGGGTGFIRVPEAGVGIIGKALDAGATGVIVPLLDTATDAELIARAAKFPPLGSRSRGPARKSPSLQGTLEEINEKTLILGMIETRSGLDNVESIVRTPNLDGLYIGPGDLSIGLGGYGVDDPAIEAEFSQAVDRILTAANDAGKFVVFHTSSAEVARQRRAVGYTNVTIANDVNHLCDAAAAELRSLQS